MRLPRLDPGLVQVWTASLQADEAQLRACEALLSADELERARRFRLPALRRRYSVAHAILRRLLADLLDADGASLHLIPGPHGKPALRERPQLCFNLSHAGDHAMFALAWQREVGVDLEQAAPDLEVEAVARQAFSASECAALAVLPPPERRQAFFRLWTRKEAYVKALGLGLAHPAQSFAVSARPQDGDALLFDQSLPQATQRWRVADVNAPSGHHAALAAAGRDWIVLQPPVLLGAPSAC